MMINDVMQQGMQQQAAPPAGPQAVPEQNAQPDPKELHKKLGMSAMQIIYDKEGSKKLVELMKSGADDPINAVAQAVMIVLDRLKRSVKSTDIRVVYSVAPTVTILLLEMAKTAKLFDSDPSMVPEILKALAGMTQHEDQPQGPQTAPGEQMPPAGMPPAGKPQMQQEMMSQGA